MCESASVYFEGTHLSHAGVGVSHLNHRRVGRGGNLQTNISQYELGVTHRVLCRIQNPKCSPEIKLF